MTSTPEQIKISQLNVLADFIVRLQVRKNNLTLENFPPAELRFQTLWDQVISKANVSTLQEFDRCAAKAFLTYAKRDGFTIHYYDEQTQEVKEMIDYTVIGEEGFTTAFVVQNGYETFPDETLNVMISPPRALVGMKISTPSGKIFWVFNIHLPLRGGGAERYRCFEKIFPIVEKICGNYPYFINMDSNLIPDKLNDEIWAFIHGQGFDTAYHGDTFYGYDYEAPHLRGLLAGTLDLILSKQKPIKNEGILHQFEEYNNQPASDHVAICATFMV